MNTPIPSRKDDFIVSAIESESIDTGKKNSSLLAEFQRGRLARSSMLDLTFLIQNLKSD